MNFKLSLLSFLRTEDSYEVCKSRMFEFEIWLWENTAFLPVCDCRRNHWEPLRVFKLLLMVQLMSKPIRIYDSVFWIKIILVLNVTQMYFTCKKELFFFFSCLRSITAWHFSCEKLIEGLMWCIKPLFIDGNLYTFTCGKLKYSFMWVFSGFTMVIH